MRDNFLQGRALHLVLPNEPGLLPYIFVRASTTPSNRSRHRGVRSSRLPSQKETCGSRHSVIPLAMCSASSSKEFADREGRPRPRLLRLPQVGWDRGNHGRHSRMGYIQGLSRLQICERIASQYLLHDLPGFFQSVHQFTCGARWATRLIPLMH